MIAEITAMTHIMAKLGATIRMTAAATIIIIKNKTNIIGESNFI
jgi:hypothetical protein